MKSFKCYNANLKANVLSYCSKQCMECERKQLIELSNATSPLYEDSMMEVPMAKYDGYDEDGSPLPGNAIWNEKKVEEVYTRNHLVMFAGFCYARKRMDPSADIGDIVDEFRKDFGIK